MAYGITGLNKWSHEEIPECFVGMTVTEKDVVTRAKEGGRDGPETQASRSNPHRSGLSREGTDAGKCAGNQGR